MESPRTLNSCNELGLDPDYFIKIKFCFFSVKLFVIINFNEENMKIFMILI